MKVSGNETLVINDKSCKVQESAGTITRTVTFLYEVQAAESSSLKIGNLALQMFLAILGLWSI